MNADELREVAREAADLMMDGAEDESDLAEAVVRLMRAAAILEGAP